MKKIFLTIISIIMIFLSLFFIVFFKDKSVQLIWLLNLFVWTGIFIIHTEE